MEPRLVVADLDLDDLRRRVILDRSDLFLGPEEPRVEQQVIDNLELDFQLGDAKHLIQLASQIMDGRLHDYSMAVLATAGNKSSTRGDTALTEVHEDARRRRGMRRDEDAVMLLTLALSHLEDVRGGADALPAFGRCGPADRWKFLGDVHTPECAAHDAAVRDALANGSSRLGAQVRGLPLLPAAIGSYVRRRVSMGM